MELTRCNNGHFYDADRFAECPYCNGTQTGANMETVPLNPPRDESKELTSAWEEVTSSDDAKTLGFFERAIGKEPVVGWLVCIEGNHSGESFNLKEGRNFIGRAATMDVVLSGDNSIAREKHAIIVYEPRANEFMVQPGDSRGLSYLNDKVILGAEVIKAYDVLLLGQTKLAFVPFCGDKFKWNDKKEEEQE